METTLCAVCFVETSVPLAHGENTKGILFKERKLFV